MVAPGQRRGKRGPSMEKSRVSQRQVTPETVRGTGREDNDGGEKKVGGEVEKVGG